MLKSFFRAKFAAAGFVLIFMTFSLFPQIQQSKNVRADEIQPQNQKAQEKSAETENQNHAEKINLPPVTTYIRAPLENKISFTQEEIKSRHFSDLPQLLSESGVQLISYGNYGLEQKPSIRGFTDETVRVVIDGICVNDRKTGAFDFSSINLNSVEKIEIIKGGFTEGVEDEGAVGGVIYITMKKSFSKEFSADTKIKTFFNPQTPIDLISQNIGFSFPIFEATFLNFEATATSAQNNFQKNDSFVRDIHSFLRLTNYFGKGNSLSVTNQNYAGKKNLPGTENSQNHEKLKDFVNNFYVNLFTPNLFSLFNFKNTFFWQSSNRNYASVAEESTHILNNFSYSANADFFDWKNVSQKAGLTFEYTNLNSTNDGKRHYFSGVVKETTQIYFNRIFYISVPFGAKFSNKNFALLPKIAFCADISKINDFFPLKFTLNAYRLVQFPTMDDLYWQGENFHGNENLKPENGWGADFFVDYCGNFAHGDNVKIGLQFFTNYYENKIQWAFFENEWQPQNVASAFFLGADFSAKIALLENHIKINFSGEYLYTKLLDKSNKYTYGKKIMWTPDFTAAAQFGLNFAKWNCNISASYVGKRYISNVNAKFLKPYVLLSAGGEFFPVKQICIYARADNILNAKYESIENYKMPGISLTVGIKFSAKN